jgi:ribosome-binding protein aMBF1 (putative translation factor)
MERCIRCNVSGNDVRLFDAIYEGLMEKICERCSIIENTPIIKKPDTEQLKDSEQLTVYKRMKQMTGFSDDKKKESFFVGDKLKELDSKPELELPEKNKLNLIEHFHWEIMKNRRRKGLSQKQLAENLGESEMVITMIEKAKLPENAENLITKLEQFFQIRLRKRDLDELMKIERRREKPVLLDEQGNELENIPEPEIEIIEEEKEPEKDDTEIEEFGKEEIRELEDNIHESESKRDVRGMNMEKGELDIHKANLDNITISDLKELHRKKVEATKQEQEEEKTKIEERQRLIEAKKEELRLLREKESRNLDEQLGGSELLRKKNEDLI